MSYLNLDTAASRALQALEASTELPQQVEERAMVLWILADSKPARQLCQRLSAEITAALQDDPSAYDDLYLFALSLNAVYAFDKHLITGDIQAMIARRLVAAEVMPGGPYADAAKVVYENANMQIAYLIAAIAQPLPNLQPYYKRALQWYQRTILALPEREAAIKWAHLVRAGSQGQPAETTSIKKNKEYVYATAQKMVLHAAPSLRPRVLSAIDSLNVVDKSSEVALLPLMYVQSLQRRPAAMTDTLCCNLGVANIFCWVAYTIFDDFIDAEGIAATMPVAAYAQRTMLETYMELSQSGDASTLIREVFNTMDEANSWELNHCRALVDDNTITIAKLPDYGNLRFLYERSLGHALGPLLLQQIVDAAQVGLLREAFCHYLIARQLNDDLHDWVEDLSAGQLSYVVVSVLQDAGIDAGTYKLADVIPSLRKIFWQRSIGRLGKQVIDHCQLARTTLNQVAPLRQGTAMLNLIQRLEDSVGRSIEMRDNGRQFIESWSRSSR